MTRTRIWNIWRRAETGPMCPTNKFEIDIYWKNLKRITKEYGIAYDPEVVVPLDDTLIDDCFKAAVDLILEVGILCTDTHRIIQFEEEEIKEMIQCAPKAVTLGEGKDAVTLIPRKLEDPRPAVVLGRVNGPTTEEVTLKLYQSLAMEPRIDILNAQATITTLEGIPVKVGAPIEMHAEICSAMWAREAIRRAGRPGMPLWRGPAATAAPNIGASSPEYGYRRCDAGNVETLPHMKTNYQMMCRAAHYIEYGCPSYGQGIGFVGGLSGGPETTVVSSLAEYLSNYLLYQIDFGWPHVVGDIMFVCLTNRVGMWATFLASAAASKHAQLIHFGPSTSLVGGTCTDMILYECAASTIGGLAVGSHLGAGMGRQTAHPDYVSGMEGRFTGEVGYAAVGMKRENANEFVKEILRRYEDRITNRNPPIGKKFQECYDQQTLTPSEEYIQLYNQIKSELQDMGLVFEY